MPNGDSAMPENVTAPFSVRDLRRDERAERVFVVRRMAAEHRAQLGRVAADADAEQPVAVHAVIEAFDESELAGVDHAADPFAAVGTEPVGADDDVRNADARQLRHEIIRPRLRQLRDPRILRRIESGDAVHDRPVMRRGVQHHVVLGVVIDRQLDDRVRLRVFRPAIDRANFRRRHVPADRIAQLDQKRDGDDCTRPFRAPRDERDRDRDENRQSDMRDERPSRRNADGAKSGDVVEEESIERRPQSERADEAEEDPGPGEGERLPFARGERDERETERERAGEKPALRIGRGIIARRIRAPREVVQQPVARHRGEAHRLVPRPLHSVQLRRGVIRVEKRRDEEQRDPAGDRDPPQRRPEDGDRHHDRNRSEEKEMDVR